MSCGAVLQKYDLERDEAQSKRIAAATWGVEQKSTPKDGKRTSRKPLPANGQRQTMTQKDIMRNHAK